MQPPEAALVEMTNKNAMNKSFDSTKDGLLILKTIQPEGKKKMLASAYLNGLKNKEELIGKVLV